MSKQSDQVYDVIIVGAGISGLNAAYILKKRCKKIKILILEAKGQLVFFLFLMQIKG